MCCHHCRTWNRELATITTEPRRTKYGWIDSSRTDKRRMYYRICMIRYFLYTVSPNNNFKDKLKTDRARIQVGRISGFGLLEMSRQRLRPGMLESTTQPCAHCHGTGLIRSDASSYSSSTVDCWQINATPAKIAIRLLP